MKKKFGELLLERGLITPEQLADALALQRRRGMRLGAALVARGHMTETQLVQALGSVLHIQVVDLTKIAATPEAIKQVSARFAEDHELFPYALRKERGRKVLSVAMSDPLNYRAIDELSFMTDSLVEPTLARSSDIDAAITKHYGQEHRPSSYGKDAFGADLLALDTAAEEKTTMTILRKGGAEETVDVVTGKVVSPFIKGPDGSLLDNPAVALPAAAQARGEEISAVLLTEEVADSTPVSPALKAPVPPPGATQTPSRGTAIPPAATTNPRAAAPRPGVPPAATTSPNARPPVSYAQQPHVTAPMTSAPQTQARKPPTTQPGGQPAMQAQATQPMQQPQAMQPGMQQAMQPGVQQQAMQPSMQQQAMQPGMQMQQPMQAGAPQTMQAGVPQPLMQPPQAAMPAQAPAAAAMPAPPQPTNPYFDDALGALLDAAGGAVNAEQFYRLERKFWALMRLLAKKGIISSEEFIEELGEE